MNSLRRLSAHDCARAILFVLGLNVACGLAELFCTLMGAPK
jgi:hypothetical protein